MEVVSQVVMVESVTGRERVWMANQVPVGFDAYAKSSCAEKKFGISVVPVIVTVPRKTSPVTGDVIVIGGSSCAAVRRKTKSRSKRNFINRTYKFNIKRNDGQIRHIGRPKCQSHSPEI